MTDQAFTLPPTGYEYGDARSAYVERYGSTLVMNTYLKIALLGLSAVAVGLIGLTFRIQRAAEHVKPLVIRIDDVGRATAVSEATLTYTPQAPEPSNSSRSTWPPRHGASSGARRTSPIWCLS
jgi:type IV secretory pathway TrbF-like protein